jgi:integrase/recombinase XerD
MYSKQIQKSNDIIVHDFDRRIENEFMTIQSELSPKNVEIIKKYDMEMVRGSLSKATRLKHIATLLSLTRILKKDWDTVTKQDIDQIIYEVITKYSPNGQETHTTWDHKKILKIFFRWFKLGSRDSKAVGDPEETKHIRLKPVKNRIVREQLITENDLSALLKACVGNPRDKAFLHVHYEAGTRPGEILSLKIKHVKFDKYGAFINVDGKTNARPIRLVRSVPDLAQWLDVHPLKDNPDAPLWVLLDQSRLGKPMTYYTAERLLARVVERSKINKKVNLKLFRHSEATNSAKYLTESQMRIRHGWTPTSNMPANYVHLVNADVDSAYLKHLGIVGQDEEKPWYHRNLT